MRALLDINVLIALIDQEHASHPSPMMWFRSHAKLGWASCPITQNACMRIMSHLGYPNSLRVRAVMARLVDAAASELHVFWADDSSLLVSNIADFSRVQGPRPLTDVYLLALAVRHNGRFVTFDSAVALEAVKGAKKSHLLVL